MTEEDKARLHQGADHSSPYPVSRLAPSFHAPDLAEEVARAETILGARTKAKLTVIADQIKALQSEARKILEEARDQHGLNHATCSFKRIPGRIYHLYRKASGATQFSMLSPDDWCGEPPDTFLGSYRLELDYSWTAVDGSPQADETGELVDQLLAIGFSGDDRRR